MTNGDRIRTYSDAQLAMILGCPADNPLMAVDGDSVCTRRNSGLCESLTTEICAKCIYQWLQEEEG